MNKRKMYVLIPIEVEATFEPAEGFTPGTTRVHQIVSPTVEDVVRSIENVNTFSDRGDAWDCLLNQ